jgi:hypothetical protein
MRARVELIQVRTHGQYICHGDALRQRVHSSMRVAEGTALVMAREARRRTSGNTGAKRIASDVHTVVGSKSSIQILMHIIHNQSQINCRF